MAFLANRNILMVHQGLPFAPAMHCLPASVCDVDVDHIFSSEFIVPIFEGVCF